MRLKPIEPGMVIHFETDEEKKILLEALEEQGYVWTGGAKPTTDSAFLYSTIHVYSNNSLIPYKHITLSNDDGNMEFSNLIIPELSAEEVFEIMAEMHKECYGKIDGCLGCPIRTVAEHCDADCFGKNANAIIEVCEQWKADHSKKEPEVEWVYDCFQNSNIKNAPEPIVANTEDEAKKYCEDMAKKYPGEAFAYIPVCRVKV